MLSLHRSEIILPSSFYWVIKSSSSSLWVLPSFAFPPCQVFIFLIHTLNKHCAPTKCPERFGECKCVWPIPAREEFPASSKGFWRGFCGQSTMIGRRGGEGPQGPAFRESPWLGRQAHPYLIQTCERRWGAWAGGYSSQPWVSCGAALKSHLAVVGVGHWVSEPSNLHLEGGL